VIEQFLNIEQADVPGILLPGERFLESVRAFLFLRRVVINDG